MIFVWQKEVGVKGELPQWIEDNTRKGKRHTMTNGLPNSNYKSELEALYQKKYMWSVINSSVYTDQNITNKNVIRKSEMDRKT